MLFLGLALLIAVIFVVSTGLIALVGAKRLDQVRTGSVVALIVLTLLDWPILYMEMPVIGLSLTSFYQSFWFWIMNLVLATVIIGLFSTGPSSKAPSAGIGLLTVGVAILLLFGALQGMGGVWTQSRASTLAKLANVQEAPVDAPYPQSDEDHLMQVTPETADELAKTAMGNSLDRSLSTFYEHGERTEQSIDDHRYYLYPLHPHGYRESGQHRGTVPVYEIPGFIVVDAENPNVQAQIRTTNEQGQPYAIKYTPGSVFEYRLERHLWTHGYTGVVVSDLTLEVDDDWNPYFTGSRDRQTYNFLQTVPDGLITVNAQTGKIDEYSLGELPPWVDRVYSAAAVEAMLNWWGEWGAGAPYKPVGKITGDRFRVAENKDPVLIYTEGGHPAWQVTMTSFNDDNVANYLAHFEARSNTVTLYPIKGLQAESKVIETIKSAAGAQRMSVRPVAPALHSIYGHLSWVVPLVGHEGAVYQGIAFMKYDDPSGSSVALGRTLGEALTIYRQKLVQPDDNPSPQKNANQRTAEGMVTELARQDEGGQSFVYFRLDGNQERGYRVPASPDNLELVFLGVGDRVRFDYIDPGPETKRFDVGTISVVAEAPQLQPTG